jgi:hypothetical protein
MRILAIMLLTSSLGAVLPSQTPVNRQAVPDPATGGGLRVVFLNKSALPPIKAAQSEIDIFQKKFTEENRVNILLDLAEFANKGLALWWTPEVDVTQSFIEAYKEYQTTGIMPLVKTTIPKASMAVLDIQAFYDGKTGIKQLVRRMKEATQKFPDRNSPSQREGFGNYLKETRDTLFKALDAFAKERGFNFIFNAGGQSHASSPAFGPNSSITRSRAPASESQKGFPLSMSARTTLPTSANLRSQSSAVSSVKPCVSAYCLTIATRRSHPVDNMICAWRIAICLRPASPSSAVCGSPK